MLALHLILMTTEAKKENWLNWLAITTILFSAAATVSTFKGGGMSTKALMSQIVAADNWAFFQAKSVKQHLAIVEKDHLTLEAMGLTGEKAKAYQTKLDDYAREIARYDQEKTEKEGIARKSEDERKKAQQVGSVFGSATILLQMSIILGGLGGLLKKKAVWILGIVVGGGGLYYFFTAMILYSKTF